MLPHGISPEETLSFWVHKKLNKVTVFLDRQYAKMHTNEENRQDYDVRPSMSKLEQRIKALESENQRLREEPPPPYSP